VGGRDDWHAPLRASLWPEDLAELARWEQLYGRSRQVSDDGSVAELVRLFHRTDNRQAIEAEGFALSKVLSLPGVSSFTHDWDVLGSYYPGEWVAVLRVPTSTLDQYQEQWDEGAVRGTTFLPFAVANAFAIQWVPYAATEPAWPDG
jgi:hypothetical protein